MKTIQECMEEVEAQLDYITRLYQAYERGDIKDLKIVWNTTDQELIADIFFRPVKAVPYINLNFVTVKSNVSFDEVIATHGKI